MFHDYFGSEQGSIDGRDRGSSCKQKRVTEKPLKTHTLSHKVGGCLLGFACPRLILLQSQPWGTCLTFKMTFYDTKVVVNTCILGIHFATQ